MAPGCQCKINIFVLMEGDVAEAAIINASWAALLRLGLPMKRSIWALSSGKNVLVANLFGNHEIVYGKYAQGLSESDL